MTVEQKMLKNCFNFEQEVRMNKLGIFLLKKEDLSNIKMPEDKKKYFFGTIDEEFSISRTKWYYCFGVTKEILKHIQETLDMRTNKQNKMVIYALNEFMLNHFAAYWYSLQYNQEKKNLILSCRLYEQVQYMAGNILNVLIGSEEYYCIDFEFLNFILNNVNLHNIDFRVPECDNKIDIVKEISWLLYSKVISEVDAIMLPMFGAFHLMLFASVIFERLGIKKDFYPINIGFHDETNRKKQEMSQFNLQGKNVLVLDDNIGSGSTIIWCKNYIEKQHATCITRVCEIPWDVYCRINKYDVISENLNMPSVKNNFRILSKNIFINEIMSGNYNKIFSAEHLYVNQDEELKKINKRIFSLTESNQFSSEQLVSMHNELKFYEKSIEG